jgi:hypothetical protein
VRAFLKEEGAAGWPNDDDDDDDEEEDEGAPSPAPPPAPLNAPSLSPGIPARFLPRK